MNKTTSGTVLLGGTNSYAGGTNVTEGLLVFSAGGAIPATNRLTVGSGAYLGAGFAVTQADFFDRFAKSSSSGILGLEATPSGPIDLTGFVDAIRLGTRTSATLDGGNTITPAGTTYRLGGGGGTLTVNSILADGVGGAVRSLDVGSSGSTPAGSVVLVAGNTYTGTTTINSGALRYGVDNALPVGTVAIRGGTLDLAGFTGTVGTVTLAGGSITGSSGKPLTATGAFQMQCGTASADLAGAVPLNKTTSDTVLLAGSNSYTGGTNASEGMLVFNQATAIPGTGSISVAAGAYVGAAFTATSANFFSHFDRSTPSKVAGVIGLDTTLSLGSGTTIDLTGFDDRVRLGTRTTAYIPTTVSITPAGTTYRLGGGGGTLNVSRVLADGSGGVVRSVDVGTSGGLSAGIVMLNGSNTYSGDTAVNAGTLKIRTSAAIPNGPNKGNLIIAGGAKLDLNSISPTVNGLFGDGTVDNASNIRSVTFTIGNNNAQSSFSGIIKNTGAAVSVTKIGEGTLTLGGVNTYSGGTTVSGGILRVDGSIASAVTLGDGTALGGAGRAASVVGSGLVSPGASAGVLTAASVDPSAGLDFAFEFTRTGSPDYAHSADSKNDVLHMIAPLSVPLTAINDLSIYFDTSGLALGNVFNGGFYVDESADLLPDIAGATTHYFVRGDGNGGHAFNNQEYYTLAEYGPSLWVNMASVLEQADFSGGVALGRVVSFTIVPEPSTLGLLAAALVIAGLAAISRRRGGLDSTVYNPNRNP